MNKIKPNDLASLSRYDLSGVKRLHIDQAGFSMRMSVWNRVLFLFNVKCSANEIFAHDITDGWLEK